MNNHTETLLLTKMNQLMNTMKQLRQLKATRLSMIDSNTGQGRVLAILKNQPTLTQKELLELLDIQPQSVSELVKKLEKKKYITRSRSASDKRAIELSLTPTGIEATKRLTRDEADHFHTLSSVQQKQLEQILDKLIDSFNQENEVAKENFGDNIFGTRKK